MTEIQIQKSIQTQRLQLSFSERVIHYGIVFFEFMILILFVLLVHFEMISMPINSIYCVVLMFLCITIIHYRWLWGKLKLHPINSNLTKNKIEEIISKIGIELDWDFQQRNQEFIVARTIPTFFSGRWGERITIIFQGSNLLVNSICDPAQRRSIYSTGWKRNNQHIKRLKNEIGFIRDF